MELSFGVEYWSGVVKFWSGKSTHSLLIILYSMEWSLRAEYWCGVESDFGVAKVERSAVLMCVCVPKFYVIL